MESARIHFAQDEGGQPRGIEHQDTLCEVNVLSPKIAMPKKQRHQRRCQHAKPDRCGKRQHQSPLHRAAKGVLAIGRGHDREQGQQGRAQCRADQCHRELHQTVGKVEVGHRPAAYQGR